MAMTSTQTPRLPPDSPALHSGKWVWDGKIDDHSVAYQTFSYDCPYVVLAFLPPCFINPGAKRPLNKDILLYSAINDWC